MKAPLIPKLHKAVLHWYDHHQRALPWRSLPGDTPNPYHVWLSEIMLQQTTVPTVIKYFENFLHLWPRVEDLAKASLDDVLHAWQGLGYYARARNLHKCAGVVANELGGHFPRDEKGLRSLPGIGPYTAAAIMSIAFDTPAPVMDGNIERIMARLYGVTSPLPEAKKILYDKATALTPNHRPGDYAQALMDLASRLCTPKGPICLECPLEPFCKAATTKDPAQYPKREPKVKKPTRYGTVYWLENSEGAVLIQKRPAKGLLAGLMEIPSSPWIAASDPRPLDMSAAPVNITWKETNHLVEHTFTHFHLVLRIVQGTHTKKSMPIEDATWCLPDHIKIHAFPTLMRKVILKIW